ncbi:MAG: hypothetical protein LC799_07020, partial [Actinobacteria bacterium]|nr:hypothetical protein [Actinomycetota bacterium]
MLTWRMSDGEHPRTGLQFVVVDVPLATRPSVRVMDVRYDGEIRPFFEHSTVQRAAVLVNGGFFGFTKTGG